MKHKHPEKWKNMLQPKETHTKLQKNEAIKMILHFILKEDEKEVSHELFTIVQRENKAIAKRITSHIDRERKGACNGHSDEIVEYPIKDTDILIDEMRAIISGFVHKMNDQEDIPLKTSEMIYMQITKQETNQRMIEKIQQDKTPETKERKDTIMNLLGLDSIEFTARWPSWEQIEKLQRKKEKKPKKDTKLIDSEKQLIKKYGKKRIEKLAKEIGYKGELINKNKNDKETKKTKNNKNRKNRNPNINQSK